MKAETRCARRQDNALALQHAGDSGPPAVSLLLLPRERIRSVSVLPATHDFPHNTLLEETVLAKNRVACTLWHRLPRCAALGPRPALSSHPHFETGRRDGQVFGTGPSLRSRNRKKTSGNGDQFQGTPGFLCRGGRKNVQCIFLARTTALKRHQHDSTARQSDCHANSPPSRGYPSPCHFSSRQLAGVQKSTSEREQGRILAAEQTPQELARTQARRTRGAASHWEKLAWGGDDPWKGKAELHGESGAL